MGKITVIVRGVEHEIDVDLETPIREAVREQFPQLLAHQNKLLIDLGSGQRVVAEIAEPPLGAPTYSTTTGADTARVEGFAVTLWYPATIYGPVRLAEAPLLTPEEKAEILTPEEIAMKYCDPDRRLTDAGRAYVGQFAKRVPGVDIVEWPQHVFKQWNGCSEPCDMWTGPCACGAYHREGR